MPKGALGRRCGWPGREACVDRGSSIRWPRSLEAVWPWRLFRRCRM